jgi:hypothetical protein
LTQRRVRVLGSFGRDLGAVAFGWVKIFTVITGTGSRSSTIHRAVSIISSTVLPHVDGNILLGLQDGICGEVPITRCLQLTHVMVRMSMMLMMIIT